MFLDIEFSYDPKLGLSDMIYHIGFFPLGFLCYNRSLLTLAWRTSWGELMSIYIVYTMSLFPYSLILSQFRNYPNKLYWHVIWGAVNSVIYKLMDTKYKGILFRRHKIKSLNVFKDKNWYGFFDHITMELGSFTFACPSPKRDKFRKQYPKFVYFKQRRHHWSMCLSWCRIIFKMH